jgi:hypothetical protein
MVWIEPQGRPGSARARQTVGYPLCGPGSRGLAARANARTKGLEGTLPYRRRGTHCPTTSPGRSRMRVSRLLCKGRSRRQRRLRATHRRPRAPARTASCTTSITSTLTHCAAVLEHLNSAASSRATCCKRSSTWPRSTWTWRAARPHGRGAAFRIAVVAGEVGRTLLFHQTPPTGEQLHQSGDDLVQHRLQRFIGRRGCFDELRRAISAAPVHAVQHQARKVDVQVGR